MDLDEAMRIIAEQRELVLVGRGDNHLDVTAWTPATSQRPWAELSLSGRLVGVPVSATAKLRRLSLDNFEQLWSLAGHRDGAKPTGDDWRRLKPVRLVAKALTEQREAFARLVTSWIVCDLLDELIGLQALNAVLQQLDLPRSHHEILDPILQGIPQQDAEPWPGVEYLEACAETDSDGPLAEIQLRFLEGDPLDVPWDEGSVERLEQLPTEVEFFGSFATRSTTSDRFNTPEFFECMTEARTRDLDRATDLGLIPDHLVTVMQPSLPSQVVVRAREWGKTVLCGRCTNIAGDGPDLDAHDEPRWSWALGKESGRGHVEPHGHFNSDLIATLAELRRRVSARSKR